MKNIANANYESCDPESAQADVWAAHQDYQRGIWDDLGGTLAVLDFILASYGYDPDQTSEGAIDAAELAVIEAHEAADLDARRREYWERHAAE